MNSEKNKPEKIKGLDRLKVLFSGKDKIYPSSDDESNIPVLEESIPELNEIVEVDDNYSVSLDLDNSTETVEQQMVRTHHEEEPEAPELVESIQFEQSITLADSDLNDIREQVMEKTWEKVEMLLISHLPPQLSGSYLHILNARIEENKQQILEELSYLDKQRIEELLESLTTEDDKRS